MKFFEISCKSNINVHEIMARMILECYKRVSTSSGSEGVKLSSNSPKAKGGCCDKKKK